MSIYASMGVKTAINLMGPFSALGGSLMAPEVLEAMAEAAKYFVDMDELHEKAGKRIAELAGAPAAYVTSGAAAGLAIAAAACMAGDNPSHAKRLPSTAGLPDDIIMLRSHRIHYDQAVRIAGAHIVDVGFSDWSSAEDIEGSISESTAGILYVAKAESVAGSVPLNEVIELARVHSLPVIVDAADELPPLSNLRRFTDMGADIVLFSGGKDIRGPQGSGLILGTTKLIKACACSGCPRYGIGRPMKVDKEEIVGLLTAVELYVKQDFEAEMTSWKQQVARLVEGLSGLPHVIMRSDVPVNPGEPGSYHLPAAMLVFDEEELHMTRRDVIKRLQEGDPRIFVGESADGLILRVQMLEESVEALVIARLRETLQGSSCDDVEGGR